MNGLNSQPLIRFLTRPLPLAMVLLLPLGTAVSSAFAADAPQERVPVILDTDVGTDFDDSLGLAAAVAAPQLDLLAITTSGGSPGERAWLVCHFLTAAKRKEIPVAAGAAPQPDYPLDWQIQYRRHPAVIWNRTSKPAKQSAVELIQTKLKASTQPVTIIATGPLTNIVRALSAGGDLTQHVNQIVLTERGALRDPESAKAVLSLGVPVLVVPDAAAANFLLSEGNMQKMFAPHSRFSMQVEALYQMWDRTRPRLDAPLAVAMAIGPERFGKLAATRFTVSDDGHFLDAQGGQSNGQRLVGLERVETVQWLTDLIVGYGPTSLPGKPINFSKLIPAGPMPTRVHAWEDYDTDIERRWWMAGKLETKETPAASARACRSVLTQDFDDRQGNMETMYGGVIFNPVPGPPMGPRTRLAFRYRLHGTDTMRIAIFSLSKGYHRYLTLTGLPQDQWNHGAVDMTEMRRPDGEGGPLEEHERIDDVQFYVDPQAEVIIDDMVLYEAAAEGETEPFPHRILYTGVFDTGRQGAEWPGEFEIVPYEPPRKWKFAQSVASSTGGPQTIRLGLRGDRQVGTKTGVRFKYRLTGAAAMEIALRHKGAQQQAVARFAVPKEQVWATATVMLDTSAAGSSLQDRMANELVWTVPAGAQLQIDDVILFEPSLP